MIGRAHHLHDDRLFESYLAERGGETVDPRAAEHLADCEPCRTRYTELADFLNGIRTEAAAETDEIFTSAELRRQQEQILRRVEHLNHAARVISFPGRVGRRIVGDTARVAPRWLAAAAVAAAAGLFVGVAVGGRFLEPGARGRATSMKVASAPSSTSRVAPSPAVLVTAPAPANDVFDDDTFLRELEFALDRPHTRELQPFDALTPYVLDIDNRAR